jgi:hypothetical protein
MNTLIWLVCIVAAFALVFWYLTTVSLPPAIKNLIIVIMGLIAIAFIYNLVSGGGLHLGISR